MKNSLLPSLRLFSCGVALTLYLTGCQSAPKGMVYRSERDLKKMEERATLGYQLYLQQDYTEAEKVWRELLKENTVSSPLYHAELGTVLLARGQTAPAMRQLREAQLQWEQLFDADSERKAAGLWSGEVNKIFRGETHERATLYAVLGMLFLDRNEVENALACFKSGLLHDADVANPEANSDYALLLYLAAHCHDKLGNPDDAARLRGLAAEAVIRLNPQAPVVAQQIDRWFFEFYNHQKEIIRLRSHAAKNPEMSKQLNAEADQLARMTLRQFLRDQRENCEDQPEKLATLKALLALTPAQLQQRYDTFTRQDFFKKLGTCHYFGPLSLPHNTLLVFWVGNGPHYERAGDYGEQRRLKTGATTADYFEIRFDRQKLGGITGFADINHQAAQRGVRKMDEILKQKAEIRRNTHTAGTVMMLTGTGLIYSGDFVCSCVGLGLLAAGGITHGIGALMTPEADIRCWKNLPAQLVLVPATLPENRASSGVLIAYRHGRVIATQKFWVPRATQPGQLRVPQIIASDLGNRTSCQLKNQAERNQQALWRVAYLHPECREISAAQLNQMTQNLARQLKQPELQLAKPEDYAALRKLNQTEFEKMMVPRKVKR